MPTVAGFSKLSDEELEGAAHLCLGAAAMSDIDAILPGGGEYPRRQHHARRGRFLKALELLRTKSQADGGRPVLLQDLGLLPKDLAWVVAWLVRTKVPEDRRRRFAVAEEELRSILLHRCLRLINKLPHVVDYDPCRAGKYIVRLVGKGKDRLDHLPEEETKDILVRGGCLHETIKWALCERLRGLCS